MFHAMIDVMHQVPAKKKRSTKPLPKENDKTKEELLTTLAQKNREGGGDDEPA